MAELMMESIFLESRTGELSWNAVADLVRAIQKAATLPEDVKQLLKRRLKCDVVVLLLNTFTVLHTITLNLGVTIRNQLVAARVFKYFDRMMAKPLSPEVASGLAQLMVDWVYLYGREELGKYSYPVLQSYNRSKEAMAKGPSDVALLYMEERKLGLPLLAFTRGLDFMAMTKSALVEGRGPTSPLVVVAKQAFNRSTSAARAAISPVAGPAGGISDQDELYAAARSEGDRLVALIKKCRAASEHQAGELALRRVIDLGYVSACRCAVMREKLKMLLEDTKDEGRVQGILLLLDQLVSVLSQWQHWVTHDMHLRRSATGGPREPAPRKPPHRAPPQPPPSQPGARIDVPDIIDSDVAVPVSAVDLGFPQATSVGGSLSPRSSPPWPTGSMFTPPEALARGTLYAEPVRQTSAPAPSSAVPLTTFLQQPQRGASSQQTALTPLPRESSESQEHPGSRLRPEVPRGAAYPSIPADMQYAPTNPFVGPEENSLGRCASSDTVPGQGVDSRSSITVHQREHPVTPPTTSPSIPNVAELWEKELDTLVLRLQSNPFCCSTCQGPPVSVLVSELRQLVQRLTGQHVSIVQGLTRAEEVKSAALRDQLEQHNKELTQQCSKSVEWYKQKMSDMQKRYEKEIMEIKATAVKKIKEVMNAKQPGGENGAEGRGHGVNLESLEPLGMSEESCSSALPPPHPPVPVSSTSPGGISGSIKVEDSAGPSAVGGRSSTAGSGPSPQPLASSSVPFGPPVPLVAGAHKSTRTNPPPVPGQRAGSNELSFSDSNPFVSSSGRVVHSPPPTASLPDSSKCNSSAASSSDNTRSSLTSQGRRDSDPGQSGHSGRSSPQAKGPLGQHASVGSDDCARERVDMSIAIRHFLASRSKDN